MPLLSMLGRVFAISTLILGLVAVSQWYTIKTYKDELLLALTGKALQDANVIALESSIQRANAEIESIKIDYETKLNHYKKITDEVVKVSVQKYRDQSKKLSKEKEVHVKDCIITHSTINSIRALGL